MKKLLALLMLLVLGFSFAACGGEAAPEPAPAPSGGDEPAPEPEPERQLLIGFNTNGLTNETMSFMVDVFYKYGEEHNIKILATEDKDDTATTINNLENFVAAGVDGVIIRVSDPVGVTPAIQDLEDRGIPVIAYDEYIEPAEYSFLCSNYDLGYAIGKMAALWANDHVDDDKIVLGLLTVEINESGTNRSNGIADGFTENCPRGEVFRQPITGNPVDVFSNMLVSRPDIKLCSSLADAAVTGIAESWYADLVGAGQDISEYGVFSTDATDIALNLINNAKKGEGIYRGTIDLGLKDRVPLAMIECCHAAILGKKAEGYEKQNFYEVKYVTEENIEEYSQFLD
ncbi:MAG: substrate-binding domain-containing protein [Oscillospiraceae bacterium]|nr:substrate-binding domain-containing protein [Oscillospiraceae bacterium]